MSTKGIRETTKGVIILPHTSFIFHLNCNQSKPRIRNLTTNSFCHRAEPAKTLVNRVDRVVHQQRLANTRLYARVRILETHTKTYHMPLTAFRTSCLSLHMSCYKVSAKNIEYMCVCVYVHVLLDDLHDFRIPVQFPCNTKHCHLSQLSVNGEDCNVTNLQTSTHTHSSLHLYTYTNVRHLCVCNKNFQRLNLFHSSLLDITVNVRLSVCVCAGELTSSSCLIWLVSKCCRSSLQTGK